MEHDEGQDALVRVSDAEREHAVERLRAACVEGRVTYEELAERAGGAYAARTRGELELLTADLPTIPPHRVPARPVRRLVAVLGDERLGGRWSAPGRLDVVAVLGDVTVDLREAEVRGEEIRVNATAALGDIRIIVPRGAVVEVSGVAVLGDKKCDVEQAEHLAPVPVVRVHAIAVFGDVVIGTGPPTSALRSLQDRWKGRGPRSLR